MTTLIGQPIEKDDDYFIFPIKPGIRNTLAGTMGELRSSHFHTGIDIRTGGQQGLAVVSAADGYISRVKVSGGGYGYTLYITHPNGTTTVYAHLKSFRDDIEEYIKEAQYSKESFEVDLFPKKDQFLLQQGDTIALSGNTGSSGGPHLHFDIRDENQNLLNPLKYGFNEVLDTRTPVAKSLALVPFSKESRVSGGFGRTEFNFNLNNERYKINDTINAIGPLGIELYAWDRMDGTRFRTGINTIELKINGARVFKQYIDSWSFSRARSFYQHVNYESLVNTGRRYHKLYVDNGNGLSFYETAPGRGQINVEDGKYYEIEISMADSYGNESFAQFLIHGSKEGRTKKIKPFAIYLNRTILEIAGDTIADNNLSLKIDDELHSLAASYQSENKTPIYLWDLREGIPDLININDSIITLDIIGVVPSRKEYKVFNEHADIVFTKYSLFDSLVFNLSYKQDTTRNIEIITIGNDNIPIQGTVTSYLKPIRKDYNHEKAAAYQLYGKNSYGYAGGKWKEDQLELRLRSFGNFTILEDSIPPMVKPLIINRDRIVFKLDDELSGINKVRASINGEWLLMASDPKRKQYWAEKRQVENNYSGKFVIEVTDNANNTKTYSTNIK